MSAFQTSETEADNVSIRGEVHYMGQQQRIRDSGVDPPLNYVVLHRPTRRKGKAMLAHCPTRFVRGAKHEHKALLDPAVTDSAAQRERRVR